MTATASPRKKRPIVVICPHCLRANELSAHFCRFCVTPLTSHAAIDPLKKIYAEMDTYSKAANSPRNVIVLVGMWLIMGPTVLALLLLVWFLIYEMAFSGAPSGIYSWSDVLWAATSFTTLSGFSVGIGCIYGILLFRTTRNYFRLRKIPYVDPPDVEPPPASTQ